MTVVYVNKFDLAMRNDPRDSSDGACRVVTNFDVLTNTYKMSPYRDSVSGDSAPTNSQKQNFCVALRTGTTYSIYSFGRQSAVAKPEILYKNLTIGVSTDLGDNGWTNTANNQSANAISSYNLFVFYKKTGLIYGSENGNIFTYDPTGAVAFNSAAQALSYTNIAQGLVHSKDDILYIPYDNKIAVNNNGAWTLTGLTLPSDIYITSICEHGNYLAIACAPLSGVGKSKVFLWDRDTSLTTVSESIDWEEGILKVIEDIGGYLIGISLSGETGTRFSDRMIFRYWSSGPRGIKFQEIVGGSIASVLTQYKQVINSRIYFMMSMTINGSVREGVWSLNFLSPAVFSIVHERTPNNDTVLSAAGLLNGFIFVGDFLLIAYQTGGNYAVSKTNSAVSYTATSIRETSINPGMVKGDRLKNKQLMAVGLLYENTPSGGQAVLKYRVNGGSWVICFTETRSGITYTDIQDAAGVPFSQGTDIEFRAESTGNVEIAGLMYDYITIPSLMNK